MKRHEIVRAVRRAPLLAARLLARGRYDFVYDQMPVSVRGMPLAKRVNLARSGLNLLHRRLQPWSMPLHMQFELTNFCNLRCPVCPTGVRELQRPAKALDPDLFRRVLDEVSPYLLTASLWGWGESILHPALGEVLRAAARPGVYTMLSTSGQHLDRDSVIEAIVDSPPTCLIVAVDGLTDETNSLFRVGARLAPLVNGVRKLAELKRRRKQCTPVLHMRFMVMKHNEHEAAAAPEFALRHGFDMLTFRSLSVAGSEANLAKHDLLLPAGAEFRAYQYGDTGRIQKSDYLCLQPFWFPSLFADGRVVCCEQDYSASQACGTVGPDGTFRDIWRSRAFAAVRRRVREEAGTIGFCQACPARDRSRTDCSVRAVFLKPEISNPIIVGDEVHGR